MKIGIINNLYKPFSRGGAEKVVESTASEFSRSGRQVFIITTCPKIKCNRRQDDNGVTIYRFRTFNFSSYYHLGRTPKALRVFWHLIDMFDLGAYFKIKKILKTEKPDLVVTHNLKGVSYLAPWILKKLKIEHHHVLHDLQLLHPSGLMIYGKEGALNSLGAKFYQAINRRLFASPKEVISPSNWLIDEHTKRGFFSSSQKIVKPNFSLGKKIENSTAKSDKSKDGHGFSFLYVGQIEEHKGILFLIKAFQKLGGEALLTIVGEGSKLEKARRLAKNGSFKFLGKLESSEVIEKMRQSDALVVPSLCYENSPTVIYEAFSVGLPVIGANFGGISELLADNKGVLFKPGDRGDLIDKIKKFIK